MHIEHHPRHSGWIEVIAGGMFSGKTEALIHRLRRAQIARLRVQTFKHEIDERYATYHIVSHSQLRFEAENVTRSLDILPLVKSETDVVGIDEGHFFDTNLLEVCSELANQGKRVIVAGLDQDYLGRPFEPMPQLLAIAEYITKLQAICAQCGNPANFSQRLVANEARVLVGADGFYEARCRRCFVPQVLRVEPAVKAESEH